jgi:intracellular septation protein
MQNNLFFDLIPLVLFFAVYYITKNIFLATGVCIVASWGQVIFCKIKYKKITKNLWVSTILITVFGGLTVILHNRTFVMLKPTVLYWIIASSMLIGQLMGKNIIKLTLEKELKLPESVWNKLNASWGLFFIVLGALNLFIAFNFSEYMWVKFKVFGTLSLVMTFVIISGLFVYLTTKHTK